MLAIYSTLTLIERLPEHLTGVIGHEIAHIIALEGKVSISKSDLYSILRNREESAKSKEKKAEAAYKSPIRVYLVIDSPSFIVTGLRSLLMSSTSISSSPVSRSL